MDPPSGPPPPSFAAPPPSFTVKALPAGFKPRLEAPMRRSNDSSQRGGRRGKVALAPEYSPLAWARLHSTSRDLSGVATADRGRPVTMAEVRKHNTPDDAWMVLHGMVYNVTPYVKFHPGGVEEIMRGAGDDGSKLFDEIHRWVTPLTMLSKCIVGPLARESPKRGATASATASAGAGGAAAAAPFLSMDAYSYATLVARKPLTKDTQLLRFRFPNKAQTLGIIKAGAHVTVRVSSEGKEVERPYTPVSPLSQKGSVDLVVKVYPDGLVSSALGSMKEGSKLAMKGPKGALAYSSGTVRIGQKPPVTIKSMVLIAAGSGLTPMLQLMREVVREKSGLKVHLVFANHTEDDIIFRPVLEEAARRFDNVSAAFVVSVASEASASAPASDAAAGASAGTSVAGAGAAGAGAGAGSGAASAAGGVPVHVGQLDAELLAKVAPPPEYDQFLAICGPEGFNRDVAKAARSLYYAAPLTYVF